MDNLTFSELRDKSHRHLCDKSFLYSGSSNIVSPEPYWINEEFFNVRNDLQSRCVAHEFQDLINAFYSVVHELEYNKIFYPDSLIQIPGYELARLTEFRIAYPVQIIAIPYVPKKQGVLYKHSYTVSLVHCKLIAKKDSLTK